MITIVAACWFENIQADTIRLFETSKASAGEIVQTVAALLQSTGLPKAWRFQWPSKENLKRTVNPRKKTKTKLENSEIPHLRLSTSRLFSTIVSVIDFNTRVRSCVVPGLWSSSTSKRSGSNSSQIPPVSKVVAFFFPFHQRTELLPHGTEAKLRQKDELVAVRTETVGSFEVVFSCWVANVLHPSSCWVAWWYAAEFIQMKHVCYGSTYMFFMHLFN